MLKLYKSVQRGFNIVHFIGEFEASIKFAEEGMHLLNTSNIETVLDLDNQLALALRDSRIPSNIDKAISIFRLNEPLEVVIPEPQTTNGCKYFRRKVIFIGK